jgi:hypothetical protein
MNSQAEVLRELIDCLTIARIRYALGGSVASSAIGFPRATLDTDLLVEIGREQLTLLAKSLGANWYLDADFAGKAVANHRAFNLIHMLSGHKFDLFPAYCPFHRAELDRAVVRRIAIAGIVVTCLMATAEDMILAKLHWYRDGGEASERQWADVVGMLTVGVDFDSQYLKKWAKELGVEDLLERATRAAG